MCKKLCIFANAIPNHSNHKAEMKGREEGRKEQSLQIARNMKAMGVPEDVISKATGLPEEEIMNI